MQAAWNAHTYNYHNEIITNDGASDNFKLEQQRREFVRKLGFMSRVYQLLGFAQSNFSYCCNSIYYERYVVLLFTTNTTADKQA